MKKSVFFCLSLLVSFFASSQMLDPVEWNLSARLQSNNEGTLEIKALIEDGWHLYGFDLPEGGPNSTSVVITPSEGVELIGELVPSRKPIKKYDNIFQLDLTWWAADVDFAQKFKINKGVEGASFDVKVRFQACDDKTCTAPRTIELNASVGTPAPVSNNNAVEVSNSETEVTEQQQITNAILELEAPSNIDRISQWWAPVTFPGEKVELISQTPWWHIFIWGFGGGLLALLTPCVWPLIPMTVSFFLKKTGSKRKAVGDAITYGISIIVIYLVLGLAVTLIFGASKLNDLATNAIFNLLFFLLLIVFAISFFGAFEITLPSRWSNSMDNKAEKTTGLISIFFMAFTLALVSFSCTGPIIGTLLVEAASMGDITGPAIGMGAFALALALPFTLFAIFPSWLKDMPRSGGWLNSVKVVLGFLELALSLKFLSVADLAYGWGILDREVFISLWVALFALLGLYLIGKLRFSHDSPKDHVSILGFFLALVSFSFSVYLLPGLWGAPLKGVSAFVPPLYTQDFNLYAGGQFEEFDDFDAGMKFALENNRPVLIDFSGYGCVNCRKMEGAVFDTQEVENVIKENFVLIKLMVDEKTSLTHSLTLEENGRNVTLETVGDKWSYLQRTKFGANSQPYYVVLDNEGKPLAPPAYYDENVTKFVDWLNGALENYKE
ncbi:MAG: thioredoxin family protein [Muribaculaceae bacterium]|nr:thioredoxin family protein [Muribaculaceae bacterium]